MQEDPLVTYCNTDISKSKYEILTDPYWTTRVYSIGKYLREYSYYPLWMPLCVYTDHGIRGSHIPFKHELESDAPTMLCHSPKTKMEWERFSSKPCFVMYSPFIFYRRKYNILPMINAKGTIAFPAHTTPSIDDISDIEIYIKQLLELPEEFQPISVCLHMCDINKGKHHIFKKYNIPIYTAGNNLDNRFAGRFYGIIKNFKYATSNMPGSYLYYCIEMGIPFSIYGNQVTFINRFDSNFPKGLMPGPQLNRLVYKLFSDLFTEISPEQKQYVEITLGLKDGLSRGEMCWVLYSSFLKWIISGTAIKRAYRYVSKWLKKKSTKEPVI